MALQAFKLKRKGADRRYFFVWSGRLAMSFFAGDPTAARAALRLCVLALAACLAACGPGDTPAPGAGGAVGAGGPGAGATPPPPEVGVVTATPGEVGLTAELPGRLEASRVAQVRARAAGIVQRRLFEEGSVVRAGQPLFDIDAGPYRAALDGALASQSKAEANVMQTASVVERYRPLAEARAISQQEFVAAQAAFRQAEADLAVARAAIQTARINLTYASVSSPIAGRIGRALVTEGALVGQGEATPMALVQQTHPMLVNFTQSASELMRLRAALDSGLLKRAPGNHAASVRLVMEDGSEYAQSGRLLFSDVTVDPSSGQVTLRAEIPNADGVLFPGLYVRVRLEQSLASNAIVLPQQSLTRSPQGDTVMVVDSEGKVKPRPVKVGGQRGTQWVVTEGLQAGEQVMVDGFQKLRGDAPVKPVPWTPPGTPAPASPGAAPAASAAPAPAAAPPPAAGPAAAASR